MNDHNTAIKEAYAVLAELGIALGAAPLTQFAGCWECQIDEHWRVAVNGHQAQRHCSFSNVAIDPFHCYIEFNGWPAGLMTPVGGTIAAGSAANEDTFITAIRARLAKEQRL